MTLSRNITVTGTGAPYAVGGAAVIYRNNDSFRYTKPTVTGATDIRFHPTNEAVPKQ